MQSMTIDSAAIRLTETILGDDGPDLEQTLKAIATNIGVQHIAYAPLSSERSEDANLLSAICTYSFEWQVRYFKKQYAESIRSWLGEGRRFFRSTGMNCPGMTRPLEHFLTTLLITMWAAMGCRSLFETARESVLWFASPAIIRRTVGPSLNREI
jgi:hypothetical protein